MQQHEAPLKLRPNGLGLYKSIIIIIIIIIIYIPHQQKYRIK